MSPSNGNWSDLRARVISGALMSAIGIGAIWAGGIAFHALGVVCAGIMIWELARMMMPDRKGRQIAYALVSAIFISSAAFVAPLHALLAFVALAMFLMLDAQKMKIWGALYAFGLLIAVYHLILLRLEVGASTILWIVAVIVASDILGYFAGRTFGGPKFWPAVSPKKTWSGTVAGWVGAGTIGAVMVIALGAPSLILPLSVLMAFAGQMGDIAESAIKRKAGVKDSSNLIPGHGGLLDRFDALAGASLFLFFALVVLGYSASGTAL